MAVVRGRVRWVAALVACAVVATGCQWVLPGYDPGGTRYNRTETAIGVAEVPGLKATWTATLDYARTSSPVVADDRIVIANGSRVVAFDADGAQGCTAATLPACSPIWTSAPVVSTLGQPIISGDRVLVLTDEQELRVYDLAGVSGCSGSPVVCEPVGIVPDVPSYGYANLTAANGRIYLYGGFPDIVAFDRDALLTCAAASQPCAPLWESVVKPGEFDMSGAVGTVIDGGRLYALMEELIMDFGSVIEVHAYDLAACEGAGECSYRWKSAPVGAGNAGSIAAVDGMVVANIGAWYPWDPELGEYQPGQVLAYAPASCAAAPDEPCEPVWSAVDASSAAGRLAVADGVVFQLGASEGGPWGLRAFSLDGETGCSGTPRVCAPLRTMVDPANGFQGGIPIVAGGVLHLGPDAWAADGSVGCSGTPVVCTPLRSGGTSAETIVVNGRLHLLQFPSGAPPKLVTQEPT